MKEIILIMTKKTKLNLEPMKTKLISIILSLIAVTALSGCVFAVGLGSGSKDRTTNTSNTNNTANNNEHPVVQQTVAPTVGQQLLDLKKAQDAGAISEQEYEAEKAKILNAKQ